MKYSAAAVLALSCSLLAANVYAADTAELKVTGKIHPAACKASFPDNSVIDFGTIKAEPQLKEKYQELPSRQVDLRISCDGPTRIAVRVFDNRAASQDDGIPNLDAGNSFGLGMYRGQNIGGYSVRFNSAIADGAAAGILLRSSGSAVWVNRSSHLLRQDGSQFSLGADSTPLAFTQLTANLGITASVSKAAYQLIADDIQLDGSISIEMLYL